ncbi:MAG TPA: hypothetical protein VEJ63_02515 [Planctomycetota bacterium]|nr:hypothetical protein [Planctomycetota bacterium]
MTISIHLATGTVTPNGVVVDVLGSGDALFGGEKIAIVARSFLPEAKDLLARTLLDSQLFEKRIIESCHQTFDTIREWFLDGVKDAFNVVARKHEQMQVFRHVDERNEFALVSQHCPVDEERKLTPSHVIVQQCLSAKARKR